MFAATLLVSGGLVAGNLLQGRARLEAQESARLMTQGRVIRQNLLRQIESTDRILQSLRGSLLGFADSPPQSYDLVMLAQGIPGIGSLAVTDATGKVTLASQSALLGVDFSGNPAVRLVRETNNPALLYIAPPVLTATSGWGISLARELTDTEGRYAGAVLATLNTEYFFTLLASVNYADDMWSAIAHDDGTLFLTAPVQAIELPGRKLGGRGSFFMRHKESRQAESSLSGVMLATGVERQMAVLTVDSDAYLQSSPLYVVVSRETQAVYAPWYREAKVLCLAYGLVLAFLLFGVFIYHRRQRGQESALLRAERELQISASRLQLATKAMGLGQWELEPSSGRSVWDVNMFRIYDVNEGTLDYQDYWRMRLLPEDSERIDREIAEATAGLRPYDVRFRIRRRRGEVRTIRSWGHVFRDSLGAPEYLVGINEDITERVIAEEKLMQRERDLKAILDNLPSLVGYWDTDLRNRFGNRTYQDWFSIDPERMPGMRLADLLDESNYQRNLPYAKAALRGEAQHFEQILPARGGREAKNTLVHYIPDVRDDVVKGFYVMVADITAAKQAETALRQSELRYRTLARVAPVGIFRLDEQGNFVYVNEHWLEICGQSLLGVLGQQWWQHVQHADLSRVHPVWLDEVNKGRTYAGEFRQMRADGTPVWVLARIATEVSLDGGSRGFVGTLTEISGLKEAEDKLRLAASVYANTQDGIVVTDIQNVIVDVNPAFSRITGYAREEAVGQNPRFLSSHRQPSEFYAGMWEVLRDEGSWRGEIWNRRKSGEDFAELLSISAVRGADGALMHYVGIFSDITRNKSYEAELSRMAHFDPLTALPNRRLLADRLSLAIARAKRSEQLLAVCYLDLDGFKPVNDNFGHEAGDRLLLAVALRLQEVLRADDTVARLGGDEFVLLLNDIERVDECEHALARVLDVVSGTRLDDLPLSVSASIGVALYPKDDADADTLLRHADQAMYLAKESGRNRYHLFDPSHDKQVRAQREALERMEQALHRGEFCLYYQPKVNLVTGEVIGAEALIRWQHPERGIVAPGEFLPMMEGTPLEIAVGEWVIETSLQQIEEWKAQGVNLPVSANISPEHLRHLGFIDHLQQALERHPYVLPGDFELEILESAAIGDIEQASRVLAAGAAMGVQFALDDFGTGYSSLTYFRRLPIGVLKIDQTFVRDMLDDPDDLGIVDSVVRLAEAFDRTTIAEGVETLEHGAMLLLLGCTFAQGYGIARPMPAEQIPSWMANWAREGTWRAMSASSARHADVALLVAVHGETVWCDGVIDSLHQGARGTTPALVANGCRFGRWWHGSAQRRHGAMPEFQRLGPLHENVHALAAELLIQAREGFGEEACGRIPELLGMQQEMLDAIEGFTAVIQREQN